MESICYGATMVRHVEWVSDIIRLETVLWERVDARLRERHDVPLSFFESLYFVSRAPGQTLRVGDLAQTLRITIGGASKLLDRIERAGLLVRRPDPHDRRAAMIGLTPAGRRRLDDAIKTYEAEMAGIVDAALTPREVDQMREYVTRLLTAADKGATP